MEPSMIDEIATSLGIDESEVLDVIGEFALQLHKRALEYRGDFIGEELWSQVSPQAFFHLLGFLDYFSDRYSWSRGDASEYLLRLGRKADWAPFNHQMSGWNITRSPHDAGPDEADVI